jgi:hypothetical protein
MPVNYSLLEISPKQFVRVLRCFPTTAQSKRVDTMFVIIPGNPGLVEFYEQFAIELCQKTNYPIIGISHTGHLFDDHLKDWQAVDLQTQIQHKVKFIKNHLLGDQALSLGVDNKTKFILVGHSIGCHVILQILNQLDAETKSKVKSTMHLFPTFRTNVLVSERQNSNAPLHLLFVVRLSCHACGLVFAQIT